jgi:hypothetical protein
MKNSMEKTKEVVAPQRSGEEECRDSLLKLTRELKEHSHAELAAAARRWESRIIFRIKMEEQQLKLKAFVRTRKANGEWDTQGDGLAGKWPGRNGKLPVPCTATAGKRVVEKTGNGVPEVFGEAPKIAGGTPALPSGTNGAHGVRRPTVDGHRPTLQKGARRATQEKETMRKAA